MRLVTDRIAGLFPSRAPTDKLYPSKLLVLSALALVVASSSVQDAMAQEPVRWSDLQIVIRDYSSDSEARYAAIATDISGAAHLMWLHEGDKADSSTWTINYAKWQNSAWSEANDVLVTPDHPTALRVVASPGGRLHLIWADLQRLWHTSASAESAADARSWTKPKVIASGVYDADIEIDEHGQLHVAFLTGEPTGPVHYMRSANGTSWSSPTTVYNDAPENVTSIHARIAVDERDRIHVTWTEYRIPNGWPPLGQWYARSEDGGSTWKRAVEIARGEQGQGDVLAVGEDEIHLVWRGTSLTGNTYHQMSTNGGRTWKDPLIIDLDGGFSGPQSLANDSDGVVHLVRSDGGYQSWQTDSWSPSPALFADTGETATFAIGLGNELHWINTTPPNSSGTATIWHRLGHSGSLRLTPRALPKPFTAASEVPELHTPTEAPTNTPPPSLQTAPSTGQSIGAPLILGLIPVMVMLAGIVVSRSIGSR